jgi:hypothetical protein
MLYAAEGCCHGQEKLYSASQKEAKTEKVWRHRHHHQYMASPSEYAVLLPYAELSSLYLAIFSL